MNLRAEKLPEDYSVWWDFLIGATCVMGPILALFGFWLVMTALTRPTPPTLVRVDDDSFPADVAEAAADAAFEGLREALDDD